MVKSQDLAIDSKFRVTKRVEHKARCQQCVGKQIERGRGKCQKILIDGVEKDNATLRVDELCHMNERGFKLCAGNRQ